MRRLLAAALLACACGQSPGNPCSADPDCGGDLVCLKPSATAQNGVCTFRYSQQGDRCLSTPDCGPGLFCSNDLSIGTRQFSGTCQPAQGDGAPCLQNANCAAPLRCRGADATQLGTCR